MPRPFHPFTAEHFIALGTGALVAVAIIAAGRRGGDLQKRTTWLLAGIALSVYPLSLLAWWTVPAEKSWDNLLPFHLCDLAAMTAGIALLTRRPLFCALTYFWGLAATIQALLTPAITVGFPALPFLMFFVHHFAVVIAALYLPLVLGWRAKTPFWKTPLEVFGWSQIYLVFAMAVNRLLGSNFAFASRPPDNPSLLDHLGAWPWYLLAMQGIALAFFLLLALPLMKKETRPANPG